jgi:hypothetical protein
MPAATPQRGAQAVAGEKKEGCLLCVVEEVRSQHGSVVCQLQHRGLLPATKRATQIVETLVGEDRFHTPAQARTLQVQNDLAQAQQTVAELTRQLQASSESLNDSHHAAVVSR